MAAIHKNEFMEAIKKLKMKEDEWADNQRYIMLTYGNYYNKDEVKLDDRINSELIFCELEIARANYERCKDNYKKFG